MAFQNFQEIFQANEKCTDLSSGVGTGIFSANSFLVSEIYERTNTRSDECMILNEVISVENIYK